MKYTKFFHHDNCLEAYDSPSLRFTYRGGNCVLSELHDTTPFLVVFNTKDFLVCTLDSSFTGKNKKKYDLYSGLWDKKKVKVKMSPFKKHFRFPLLNKEKAEGLVRTELHKNMILFNKDVCSALWTLHLLRVKLDYNNLMLIRIREFAEFYGFNTKISIKKKKIYFSLRRRSFCKIHSFKVFKEDTVCNFESTYSKYNDQGFVI